MAEVCSEFSVGLPAADFAEIKTLLGTPRPDLFL